MRRGPEMGHGRYHGHHERAEQQDGLKGDAFHPLGTHHARDAHDGEHDEDAEPRAPESRQGGAPLGCEAMGGCERLFGAGGFWRPREMEA